jgi:teichuronic acid biosynthesis glycosyltransferase TuaG
MSPRVSVVTPAFNAEAFIDKTIESVCGQTYGNWELLVSDDGSTDSTKDRVASWERRDRRIRLIESSVNEGAGAARNKALTHAKGRFIAFLDADDMWHPEKLKKQIGYMDDSGAYFTYTAYRVVVGSRGPEARVVRAAPETTYHSLLKNTRIGCLTVVIDRERIANLSMPNIPVRQPLVTWLRLLKTYGPALGLDEVLATYRARKGSISSNKLRAAQGVWRVYREFEGLPLTPCLWYFANYAFRGFVRNLGVRR